MDDRPPFWYLDAVQAAVEDRALRERSDSAGRARRARIIAEAAAAQDHPQREIAGYDHLRCGGAVAMYGVPGGWIALIVPGRTRDGVAIHLGVLPSQPLGDVDAELNRRVRLAQDLGVLS